MRRLSFILTMLCLMIIFSCESAQNSNSASSLPADASPAIETVAVGVQPGAQPKDRIQGDITSSRANAITAAIEKLTPAVVGINVTQIKEYVTRVPRGDWFFEHFFSGRRIQQEVKSMGSGFIISRDGFIVTNEHVVQDAVSLEIFLSDGRKFDAEIVGKDYITDIALLKIDGNDLPYCELGDSDDIIIGEWVIALGNPFGLFELGQKPTATVGVISASNLDFGKQGDDRVYQDMIQTDAAINPGNSGGAMANAVGQVVGVNAFIYTGGEYSQGSIGLGFAIPINRVKEVVEQLKNHGRVDRQFWTGLEVESLRPSVARYFGLRDTRGVIVTDVELNSPAHEAGFKVGDVITQFSGKPVQGTRDIWSVMDNIDARAGDDLDVVIIRQGRFLKLRLKLGRVRS
jgi:serine protease Do